MINYLARTGSRKRINGAVAVVAAVVRSRREAVYEGSVKRGAGDIMGREGGYNEP